MFSDFSIYFRTKKDYFSIYFLTEKTDFSIFFQGKNGNFSIFWFYFIAFIPSKMASSIAE